MCATGGTRPALRSPDKLLRLRLCLFRAPRAHLNQQKSAAGRQLIELRQRQPLAPHEVDQHVIEAFEADRACAPAPRAPHPPRESASGNPKHRQHAEGRAGASDSASPTARSRTCPRCPPARAPRGIRSPAAVRRGCSRRRVAECAETSHERDPHSDRECAPVPRRFALVGRLRESGSQFCSLLVRPTVMRVPS